MTLSMHQRLAQLATGCGFYHVPYVTSEEGIDALKTLQAKGLEVLHTCPVDSDLLHVAIPHHWNLEDDEASHSGEAGDIGSVLITDGENAMASIVSGDGRDPHNYSLTLP